MADYRKMYLKLFNGITDLTNELESLQQETEEIYIEDDFPPIHVDFVEKEAKTGLVAEEILQIIVNKLDHVEKELVRLKSNLDDLEKDQESIQNDVRQNNLGISEIIAKAIETTTKRVDNIETVTKDNLYYVTLLRR